MKIDKNEIVTISLATIATVTLIPVIEAGSKAVANMIFKSGSAKKYEADPDEEDYEEEFGDDEDDEEDSDSSSIPDPPPKKEDQSPSTEQLLGGISDLCSKLSEDEKVRVLKAICGDTIAFNIQEEPQDTSDEEAATTIEEEESIYTEKTSAYDSLLEETEFKGIEKRFPQVQDILRNCEEQNLSIEESRQVLRTSLRKIKLDAYSKKHPNAK